MTILTVEGFELRPVIMINDVSIGQNAVHIEDH
jgi:hypothetical protein